MTTKTTTKTTRKSINVESPKTTRKVAHKVANVEAIEVESPKADANAKANAKANADAKGNGKGKANGKGKVTFMAPTAEVPRAERPGKALEYIRANPGATAHQVAEALRLSTNYAPQMAVAALTSLVKRGLVTKANKDGHVVYSAI